ncbi:pentatricopeptide repeat-containing protein At2g36980, mitochondrial isoform X2 [Ziziphus jujuba]|uniref:Pentatricopeptide repeat-containing protein At2g36980, mitochondrial isoform X2 n=1 Tax=Ziziphus jujuba TaxID=326968 RepID=A0A6P4APT2_ZIZJJ|nr:pentatricopeptide repeat-containing protein At2g36980, mitochondrial isoform X2 [Ziziphus jujuba]
MNSELFQTTSKIVALARSGWITSARKLFDGMSHRDSVAWNAMLASYSQVGLHQEALSLFYRMRISNILPDHFTFTATLSACAGACELTSGTKVHALMRESLCLPDQWTLSAIVNACAESLEICYGCMVHAFIIKGGWSSAVEVMNSLLSFYAELGGHADVVKALESIETLSQVSWNAIIDANMKLGNAHEAFLAFQQAPYKNIVSWTSMISGCARNGLGEQAVSLFVDMMEHGIQPDDFAFGAVLHACSSLAVLGHGKMVHGCIVCYGFHAYVYVGNGLVNMYAKCGDLQASTHAFNDILDKDLISWNAMLFGFGLHGQATQALKLYEEMMASRIKPDKVTFIGLLMTCSHSGLIEESRELYETMVSVYGLSPEMDHAVCMVDMLGRGGYLSEAKELANKYFETGTAGISACEALLGACSAHLDVGLGIYLGKSINSLDPNKEISYVLLSNLYCANGRWKEAEMARKKMIDQGVKKMPGCSWIEVNNKVAAFVAGNHSHPFMEESCRILYFLESEMKNPCFVGLELYEMCLCIKHS